MKITTIVVVLLFGTATIFLYTHTTSYTDQIHDLASALQRTESAISQCRANDSILLEQLRTVREQLGALSDELAEVSSAFTDSQANVIALDLNAAVASLQDSQIEQQTLVDDIVSRLEDLEDLSDAVADQAEPPECSAAADETLDDLAYQVADLEHQVAALRIAVEEQLGLRHTEEDIEGNGE